jgi:hypothetical protein
MMLECMVAATMCASRRKAWVRSGVAGGERTLSATRRDAAAPSIIARCASPAAHESSVRVIRYLPNILALAISPRERTRRRQWIRTMAPPGCQAKRRRLR